MAGVRKTRVDCITDSRLMRTLTRVPYSVRYKVDCTSGVVRTVLDI